MSELFWDEREYINVAVGKSATQSSISHWSLPDDANGALVAASDRDYGFHTDREVNPWWQVDLGQEFPVDSIVVYNRRRICQTLARTLVSEVSRDGESWTLIHAGLVYFGDGESAAPLSLPLKGRLKVRFVRLSLREETALHLHRVAVLVDPGLMRISQLRHEHGFGFPIEGEEGLERPYRALAATKDDVFGPLIGLRVSENGHFGNSVFQYCTAIEIARRLGLRYIQCNSRRMPVGEQSTVVDDIEFLAQDAPLPAGGCFIEGAFFTQSYFENILTWTNSGDLYRIVQKYLTRIYGSLPLDTLPPKAEDELAIHIRSGDIFSSWVHPQYVQPPLAFYQMAVRRLLDEGKIGRVLLVFEDRLNPVIDALEAWLQQNNVPVRCQSGTVVEDICALIDARHVVFAVGTFGVGACLFSQKIDTVFYFSLDGTCPYRAMPNVGKVYSVHDAAGAYIKIGDWANTPEQKQLMLQYPEQSLQLVETTNA